MHGRRRTLPVSVDMKKKRDTFWNFL